MSEGFGILFQKKACPFFTKAVIYNIELAHTHLASGRHWFDSQQQ